MLDKHHIIDKDPSTMTHADIKELQYMAHQYQGASNNTQERLARLEAKVSRAADMLKDIDAAFEPKLRLESAIADIKVLLRSTGLQSI